MKLKCLSNYKLDSQGLRYVAGDVFDADEDLVTFLMADAPGCFVEHKEPKPRRKRVKRPPEDKMVTSPAKEK